MQELLYLFIIMYVIENGIKVEIHKTDILRGDAVLSGFRYQFECGHTGS